MYCQSETTLPFILVSRFGPSSQRWDSQSLVHAVSHSFSPSAGTAVYQGKSVDSNTCSSRHPQP